MLKFDKTKKIAIIGDVGPDIIVRFPKYLDESRKKVEFTTPKMVGGGTCGNTAVAVAKLGISPYIIGTVGADQYGKFILKDLEDKKVHTDYLKIDNSVNTVGVFAFIDEFGERYLWGWPRTDRCFEKLELEEKDFQLIREADWVHSSGMVTIKDTSARAGVEKIFEIAHKEGVTTSYDLNLRVNNGVLEEGFKNTTMRIIENCDYVLGSAEEEIYYLGENDDWKVTARNIASEGHTVIARLGGDGAMLFDQSGEIYVPAYKVDVVDTVGAGDVYNGAFIAAVLSGYEKKDVLKICNAVSGFTVAHEGAQSSPEVEELEQFMMDRQRG